MSASGDFGNTRACDVMFGNIDLTLGAAVEPLLQQHIEASGGRFRGVRISSGWHEDERINNVAEQASMLLDPRVHEAIAVINRMGLSLDCWLYHTQLDEFAQLIDAHPGLVGILNHVGSPILGGPYRGKTDEVYTRKLVLGGLANAIMFTSNSAPCPSACPATTATALYRRVLRRLQRLGDSGWNPA